MGAPSIVCVEVERPSGRLRQWEDAHSAHFGQIDPALREQEAVRCLPMDERPFAGRIEYGALGEMLLCKLAATNFRFTRSLTTPAPTLPAPLMLVSVSRGSVNFVQRGRTCILGPRDWALIDSKLSQGYEISSPEIEAFVTMLPRPSDPAIAALCERGVAHRWNGRAGLSRVLLAMVNESFGEMRRLPAIQRKKTGRGHRHDGVGRLARTDRDAAGDRTPRRPTDAGQGLYRGEPRRSRALRRANRARLRHFRSWAAPPFRRGSGRIRIALSLAASAHPLRGGASRPEPGASLDNRRLLLIRLQQFVAFQPAVQGSVRSSAGSLSRRARLPPSGDPGSMLARGSFLTLLVGLGKGAGRGKRVVCMDGFDTYEMPQRSLLFDHFIDGKVRRAAETELTFTRPILQPYRACPRARAQADSLHRFRNVAALPAPA